MNVWIRRGLQVGLLSAGLVVAGAAAAHAGGPELETGDNYGAFNGIQAVAPVQLPVNICGNAVGVIGGAEAWCEGGSEAKIKHFNPELESYNNYGLVNGDQVVLPIQAPIEISGNAVGVIGGASASSEGGSSATLKRAPVHGGPELESGDNYGLLNGDQVVLPIQAPINVCGNALAIIGGAEAGCEGGSEAKIKHFNPELESYDNYGFGNGIQAVAPIQVPIDVCGNAIAIIGGAQAGCEGGSSATLKRAPAHFGPELESSDNYGIADGIQVVAPIQAPINVCGNAIAIIGGAQAGCEGGSSAVLKRASNDNHNWSPELESYDSYGIGNGLQVVAPIQAPIDVCGNAVALIGGAQASCQGGSTATLKANGPELLSYDSYGLLNGAQVVAPIQLPIDISGNAVGVIGGAFAESVGGASAYQG